MFSQFRQSPLYQHKRRGRFSQRPTPPNFPNARTSAE
jgi:hypothetical protein